MPVTASPPTCVPGGCAAPGGVSSTDATVGTARGMIAIHIDPNTYGSAGLETVNASTQNLIRLAALVSKANEYGHKLTLLMSADWAVLIDNLPGWRVALKSWISSGHELGFHHHTCGHAGPDGYWDVPDALCTGITHRGSVALAYGKVKSLLDSLGLSSAEAPGVQTAAQGPNTGGIYRAAEWQPSAIYATGEMSENGYDYPTRRFLSQTRCTNSYGNSYSGTKVTFAVPEVGHSQLNVGDFISHKKDNTLAALEAEIALAQTPEYMAQGVHVGVVFHAREYYATARDVDGDDFSDDRAYLDAVLQAFATQGLPVVTAREILGTADPCSK